MNQSIRISHSELLLFSDWDAPGKTVLEAGKVGSWESDEEGSARLVACTGTFDTIRSFNSIYVDFMEGKEELFPDTFRFEISNDGTVWEPILHESNFRTGLSIKGEWHFPLIEARYIKFLFLVDKMDKEGRYAAAFGSFRVMVSGIVRVAASSELDRLWVKDNLIDQRTDYGWATSLRSDREEEHVAFDLGSINRVNEIRMLTKDDVETFFPRNFHIVYSEDGLAWHHLIEETSFFAEPGVWYRWRFVPMNMRHVKIIIDEGAKTREGKYISQIIEIEMYALADTLGRVPKSAPSTTEPIPFASVLRSGIVRLAKDGEVREGVVVQGDDRRLRDATTEQKGIVEFASSGEDREGVVVQGNDRRLKMATEDFPGIVRLARDGEVRAGNVVQGNDHRLKDATAEQKGIVELASNGEDREGVVVQGNDRRLKMATEKTTGIIQLAADGSDRPGEVIQGNDHRLKDATTQQKGILRFAAHAEESGLAAVQGDDPRLKKGTQEQHGIVRLAKDGEKAEQKVVQSHDRRLDPATEESPGIVQLSRPGGAMAGFAIQGNDPRLSDRRDPTPHDHPYAPAEHEFSSHTGFLHIKGAPGEKYDGINPPPVNFAPITGTNDGDGAGIVGRGGEGVIGSGERSGLLGIAPGAGTGVVGVSKGGAGGAFTSEQGFSLIAGGDAGRGAHPSRYALKAEGISFFDGDLYLKSPQGVFGTIARYFRIDSKDVVSAGDIVISSRSGELLQKSYEAANPSVIGVVVESANIVLDPPDELLEVRKYSKSGPLKPPGYVLVGISGLVCVKVTAENGAIAAGDLLQTSIRTGVGEKMMQKSYRPGAIFAKSLDELPSGEGIVRALLVSG